jgi:hypothetical protein
MLWSSATDTNAVWGVDEWAGRRRKEEASPVLASALSETASSATRSITGAEKTEPVTELITGDELSTTIDTSSITKSNTISRTSVTNAAVSESSKIIGSISQSKSALSKSSSLTSAKITQLLPKVFGEVGESIAEPSIDAVPIIVSISGGSSDSKSSDGAKLLSTALQKLSTEESTFLDINGVVQSGTTDVTPSDERSIVGDTATLSVSATSGLATFSEATANESALIQVSTVSTSNDVADSDDTTVSFSDDVDNIINAGTPISSGVASTSSIDSADTTVAKSFASESFEIFSALEDAQLVTTPASPIDSKNLLTVSPNAVISASATALVSEAQQINSSVDFTRIENETNIVKLEPSANEVIIEE